MRRAVTVRVTVTVAVLLLAASLCGVATASPRVQVTPRASDFEQLVPATRLVAPGGAHVAGSAHGADARVPWLTTAPLRAPRRFDLLGVRWSGDDARVELRVERDGGRWSRWIEAPPAEQPPTARTGATHAAGPVWTGGGSRYQLRSAGPLRDTRVHFVAVRRSRASSPLARPAAGGRPAIVPRSAWDPHDDCPPRVAPIYGRVDFGLVHHTVSLNGYSRADAPAIVLAICRFHRNGNGWNDIGYNLLVDRYGTVFEGRAGGVTAPVVGAQAQGWNSVSTGVAAIGDFSSASPPAALLSSIARVLAWKLGLAGIPATGAIREVSIGGELNRWPEGDRVTFQRVSGHRDGGLTECPGGALYARLPALRRLVRQLLPAPRDLLTISPAAQPQPQGGPVYLTGRLARADGSRPAGQAVLLQQLVGGAWSDVATVTTGADGIWSAGLPLTQNGAVRAVTVVSGIVSPVVSIEVRDGVRAHVSAQRPRLGATIQLTGTTTPAKPRVSVLLERRLPGDRLRFRRLRLRALATVDGGFAAPLRLPTVGSYRVTVRTPADAANAAGSSRPLTVRVLRRR